MQTTVCELNLTVVINESFRLLQFNNKTILQHSVMNQYNQHPIFYWISENKWQFIW